MPHSQSITSQETIRNGKLYNLPLNLLVAGDLIRVKPGQTINVNCQNVKRSKVSGVFESYERGKIFEPVDNWSRRSTQVDELFFNGRDNEHGEFLNSYIESCELRQVGYGF